MIYFVHLDSSVSGQACYLEWNGIEWGRCTFSATSFPSKEAAKTALKEARESIRFLAPELLSHKLRERLEKAKVISLYDGCSDLGLKSWAPKGKKGYYNVPG